MANEDIPIHLDFGNSEQKGGNGGTNWAEEITEVAKKDGDDGSGNQSGSNDTEGEQIIGRRRSNSQSQVMPSVSLETIKEAPKKRKQVQYCVTLTSLNDTFAQKTLTVPYFPDTRKLGRPTGAKIKPDVTNGFFDSRVLSRNHAAMYIEPNSSKLMLKDLGSSNGTFVNEQKLYAEPVEIKVRDNICFGFNIQVGINHKQINAVVENINIMSNYMQPSQTDSVYLDNKLVNPVEFKHYQYIEALYNKVSSISEEETKDDESPTTTPNFEQALFSDINPDIEDNLLGLHTKVNTGLFKNSNAANSTKLEDSINLLLTVFTKIKQQQNSLQSVKEFIILYQNRLDELNNQHLTQKFEQRLVEFNKQLDNEKSINESLNNKFTAFKDDNYRKTKKLEEKVYKLKEEKLDLNKQIKSLTNEVTTHQEKLLEAIQENQMLQEKNVNDNDKNDKEIEQESSHHNNDNTNTNNEKTPNSEDIDLPNTPESSNSNESKLSLNESHSQSHQNNASDTLNDDSDSDSDREREDQHNFDPANRPDFVQIPAHISDSEIDDFDTDNDLRYQNSSLALGLLAVLVGYIVHKSYA